MATKLNYKLKEESKGEIIGFNDSSLPLGDRDDLDILVEQIVTANDRELKRHFEKLPTLEEINAAKANAFMASFPSAPVAPAEETTATGTSTGEAAATTSKTDTKKTA